jgi:hypothetical protein
MDEEEDDLLVPLVACKSMGGPFDDQNFIAGFLVGSDTNGAVQELAFACGFMAGRIDRELAHAEGDCDNDRLIPDILLPQIDLIAMKYGYITMVGQSDEGWIPISFEAQKGMV